MVVTPLPLVEATRVPTESHPRRRLIVAVALGYFAAWAVGVGFGFAVRFTGTWKLGAAWERELLGWFHAHPLPLILDRLMLAAPYFGTNLTILPIMIVATLVLWKKFDRADLGIHLLVVSIGSLSLNPSMKYLLGRPRPELYPQRGLFAWASYPSGHLILTPALYFTLSLMLYRGFGWRWPFVVTVLVILTTAYSRLYLSVHWPTDLIGGLLIGFTWLFTSWRAFHRHHLTTRPGAMQVD
jgi:membrane-associated phospholipid phosphatase